MIRLPAEGSLASGREVANPADRDLHHAEHRFVVIDQSDIDGKLADPLDEFLGTVQRINQPKPAPDGAFVEGHIGRLLGKDRNLGSQSPQAVDDRPMRGEVGFGQRALIALFLYVERRAIDLQDVGGGLLGDVDDRIQQTRDAIGHNGLELFLNAGGFALAAP